MPRTTKSQTQPRAVDFISERSDRMCALFGAMGFSTQYIAKRTKLTPGQISYRLRKASVSRADYRNGANGFAEAILRESSKAAEAELVRHLRKNL